MVSGTEPRSPTCKAFIQPIELSLCLNTTSLQVNEFKSLKKVYVFVGVCVRMRMHSH